VIRPGVRGKPDRTERASRASLPRGGRPVARAFRRMLTAAIVCVAGLAACPATTAAGDRTADVVVYGGTSAGVAAAVQVARMGRSVILVEPGRHLGGMSAAGLGWTDTGDKRVIGGLARGFYRAVKRHYDDPAAWVHEPREGYSRYRPDDDAMWTFEPHVAEAIFGRMAAEHGIEVIRDTRLDRRRGVLLEGRRVVAMPTTDGTVVRGRMFIDATYEGDLLAAAGVTYAVGREANATYGETINGVQVALCVHSHHFVVPVDPYVVPGDPASGLLPGIRADAPGPDGTGDDGLQAYCFRMCLTNVAANRRPFPKPADYDERRYELLLRNFEAGDERLPVTLSPMPNGKTDSNNFGAVSTDFIGANHDYPEATDERRAEIIGAHRSYQTGLMWTLANHPRVPESVRGRMAEWGLARDEFLDHDNWPHAPYVREARRMVADYVMTEHDCRRSRTAPDPVGLGSYTMDSHNVWRFVTEAGAVQNEGDVQERTGGAYAVSYRAIVPKRGETANLLVPVCLSASHIAYGSIRMEPVFMVLGQSAATAAVLALEEGVDVQDVDYAVLRRRLLSDGQVLELP
jgi:hypothetical protein